MFTRPPEVTDADLVAILATGWGLDDVTVDYLAVGFGSHHWRATTASTNWFVTIDDLVTKRRESDESLRSTRDYLLAALATAGALREAGFEFVVAPVPTHRGQIACDLGDRFVVAVYPLVHGQTYDYGKFSDDAHRDAVVRNLAALHRSPTSCRQWAATDTFSIVRRAELFEACSQLQDTWGSGPFADPARRLLARYADAVARAFDTYDAPGGRGELPASALRADPWRAARSEHDHHRSRRRARRLGHSPDSPARARSVEPGR